MPTWVFNQELRGFWGEHCVFISHSPRGEETPQIFVGKCTQGRMCGRTVSPDPWVHHDCFFYLSSCGFTTFHEFFAVGRKVWCYLLQTVVSRDCNISTWEIDSGTTPARDEAPGHQEQLWGLVWRLANAPGVQETNSHPKGASPYILLSVLKVHLCRWSLEWVCRGYTMTEQHVGLEEVRYTSREKPKDEHRCSGRPVQLQVTTSVSKQETFSPSC